MSKLFETTRIKSLTLPNRFVRSATFEGMANPDGSPSRPLIDMMVKLAQGGVGLIITSMASPSSDKSVYMAANGQLGAHSDSLLPGLSEMTVAVHKANGRIAMQIVHPGLLMGLFGAPAVGPSVTQGEKGPLNREMNQEEIHGVADMFGTCAARAKKAGFDGVQIHAAHGWLLSEFLSPFFNKRTDDYGGSIENRARIVLETIRSVRGAVGGEYPVLIKVNSEDLLPGGLSVDDMLRVAVMFEDAGVDAIELSGGTTWASIVLGNFEASYMKTSQTEVYWREAAKRLKKTIDVPLMLVGGIRSYEVAEQLVGEGVADYVSLCRPLIREPGLVNRWKSGDTRRADCTSDNACFAPMLQGKGLRCVHVKD